MSQEGTPLVTGTLALARIAVKRIAPLGGAKYQQLNFVASSLSANKQCFVTPSSPAPSSVHGNMLIVVSSKYLSTTISLISSN